MAARRCVSSTACHVFQRAWTSRLYDLVWYLGREIPVHLAHLRARMEQTGQTGHWKAGEPLTLDALRRRLSERFAAIDFDAARAAVRPFIRAADELALWGRAFFDGLLPRLMAETKSKVNPVE